MICVVSRGMAVCFCQWMRRLFYVRSISVGVHIWGCLLYTSPSPRDRSVGLFDTELVEEFFLAFVRNCALTLHFKQLDGKNTHHIIEGAFKAFGRALSAAVKIEDAYKDEIPSTKGVL